MTIYCRYKYEDASDKRGVNDDALFDHDFDIADSYSTDTSSTVVPRRGHKFLRRKKSSVMTRGMDFVRKMNWKLNSNTGRRLSQPDMDVVDGYTHWRSSWSTQNTPRGSVDGASVPEGLIMPSSSIHHEKILILPPIHELTSSNNREKYAAQYNRALHTPTRFLPQNQSVITTNAEGSILLFNDIASLCFDINKSFIGKSVLTSLLEEPFRKQITAILARRRKIVHTQEQSDKGLVLVCGTIVSLSF